MVAAGAVVVVVVVVREGWGEGQGEEEEGSRGLQSGRVQENRREEKVVGRVNGNRPLMALGRG